MIRFGTSGWRGIIGKDITFRKVRVVTQAILDTLTADNLRPNLILIGFDTRMLSEKFALAAAQLLAANGVRVEITSRDVPSPVLAAGVLDHGAALGLTFTGSHNPPEYNGLKVYTHQGILAQDAFTERVEARAQALAETFDDTFLPRPDLISEVDLKPRYLERLQALIDWDAIRASGMHVVVDPLFGTTREYLDHILLENEVPTVVIHNTRDPYFGGYAPDCTPQNLSRLRETMRRSGAPLGLATDGDGDRFGILDQGARTIDSSQSLALLLDYLARRRGFTGRVGRSLATSCLIDAVAAHHGLDLLEMSVGFKSFGPLLVDGTLEFAGEESAGLAWARHLPERDGILACLLTCEMVAVEGKTLQNLLADLNHRVGSHYFQRTQVAMSERLEQLFDRRIRQDWHEVEGRKVVDVNRTDGIKLVFDNGSWILARKAGTEPKIRLYAEARNQEEMRLLMHLARRLFTT